MSNTAKNHMGIVSSLGCVICRRDYGIVGRAIEVHHIAEGSGKRSDFMTAGLCYEHHRSKEGLHGMGVKAFLMRHKLLTEYHLLELVNRYRSEDRV